ncbi:hypothetical protein EPIR_1193 [Erwinia piriflorinigrans CFBP 5888]|uniref:Uncharacterized protein n=1 Tax=Erwinia piriflorinigrans CFBP 5888 TaxID=1161919 RepID=V5Z5L8_9GAMM|nr:hypothetical protein EPIR_1193 [Erwinia piriflorinigrans CFBP 5888]
MQGLRDRIENEIAMSDAGRYPLPGKPFNLAPLHRCHHQSTESNQE